MVRLNLELAENIHKNLTEHIRENHIRYYYLAYSFVKNRAAAEEVVTNAVYFSLYNGRKLKSLPPMQTWILQLIVKGGMRAMSKGGFERDFTKDSQLYAYMEILEPSAVNVFKLYYFEKMGMEKICDVLHFNRYEGERRLAYVRSELKIDSSMDEESEEKLEELLSIYEGVDMADDFTEKVEASVKKEEDNFADFLRKYKRDKIRKPAGLVVLALCIFFLTVVLGRGNADFADSVLSVPFINKLFQPFF